MGGDTSGPEFQYTGRQLDAETGLYYYRARHYNPTLGRFLQTDPVGYDDNLNWYAYTGNDPLNGSDPSGEWVCDVNVSGKDFCNKIVSFTYWLNVAKGNIDTSSLEYKDVSTILDYLGEEGDDSVKISYEAIKGSEALAVANYMGKKDTITFNSNKFDVKDKSNSDKYIAGVLIHEATHAYDLTNVFKSAYIRDLREESFTENRAYTNQISVYKSLGYNKNNLYSNKVSAEANFKWKSDAIKRSVELWSSQIKN